MTHSLPLATFFRKNALFSFYSLQHHVHIHHRGDYDKQKAVVVVQASLPALGINAKRASTRKYLTGLGNLCLSAACSQGRLRLHQFSTQFRASYNQGRLTIE